MADDTPRPSDAAASDDDRPYVYDLNQCPEEINSPLGPFKGAEPPSPHGFKNPIAQTLVPRVSGPSSAGLADRLARPGAPLPQRTEPRIYPNVQAALARFRLAPPQPNENRYILDFIARRGLKPAPLADGSGEGWTWRFD